MAKKKTSSKEQEEKPKPIDRTPIIVAIIGLIGTITVTLITVFANRPAEISSTPSSADESGSGTIPAVTESSSASSTDGSCLTSYFEAVSAEHQLNLQAGISTRIPNSTDGTYGVRFFENGNFLGGMQFMGTSGTNSFEVISVINADCTPVDDFGNLERPNANGAIGNWENLGMTLSAQNYRLRMGWYGSDQIELIFQEN